MNLNPFDLRGPEFLVFFGSLTAAILIAVWLTQRYFESGSEGDDAAWGAGVAKDPYQVACLRGGRDEVIRVAVVSLVERGLLKAEGSKLHTVADDAADLTRRPLDKAILTKFAAADKGQSIYSDRVAIIEADAVADLLKEKGLLPSAGVMSMRALTAIAGIALLWTVAGIKVSVALARGHHNIIFLLLGSIVAGVLLVAISSRRRTVLGNKTLDYVQQLFAGLDARRETLHFDGQTGEVAFLAAAFGMTALPVTLAAMFDPLNLRPPRPESSGWASGSSCSSGGGGGCGGGGCGGGCGGCG